MKPSTECQPCVLWKGEGKKQDSCSQMRTSGTAGTNDDKQMSKANCKFRPENEHRVKMRTSDFPKKLVEGI
jgi:hypothetical protein